MSDLTFCIYVENRTRRLPKGPLSIVLLRVLRGLVSAWLCEKGCKSLLLYEAFPLCFLFMETGP